jgi:glycosyltransferase involved in cell wall biosynthesis
MQVVLATTARARGGVWRHVADLAEALERRGHRVVIALLPDDRALREAAREAGFAIEDFWATARWRGWTWHGHLHDTFDPAFLRAALQRRFVGSTVLTEHLPHTNASDPALQPGPRHPLAGPAKTAFKRLEYMLADRVVAVSPSSKAFLIERYGERGAAIEVVANGIDHPASYASPRAPRFPVQGVSVGSVIYQKGFDLLVDASEVMEDPPWRVSVLGEGPEREVLSRRAAERGVIEFPGWSRDVAAAITAADFACLPSRWESAPYAVLEAMNAGRPLVAFDVDGVRDYVVDGVSGLLVPPNDVDALSAALQRIATDDALRTELGRAAYRRAGEFTIDRMAEQTVSIYEAAWSRRRVLR